ncbi:integral membrane protein [Bordetella ansorpii]|uniref:Integral membrane protein n=1 Tax=Bordetella ansorpii TaxID=288768 RepID=A0A157QUK2_9BORD|nr:DUF3817 domain-containing protein [Bordetella ansorpii]SAI49565.1 integral membrane protein [Bordetella ansorpii]
MITSSRESELAQLRRLELVSVLEGTTLLLLVFMAVPLKHLGGWPYGVQALGPVHGLAFVAYLWTLVQTVSGSSWRRSDVLRMLALAIVPFGGFVNASFLARRITQLRRECTT